MHKLTVILLALCGSGLAAQIDESKVVDLTYSFDENTVYWPNAEGFRHVKDEWKVSPGGYWYAAGHFSAAEHGGTHFDSPIHFGEGKWTADQIPVTKFIGPALVIDVSNAAAKDRDYRASPADIAAWEQRNGLIPAASIVLFRTGWGKYWPDKKRYLGSDVPGDTMRLHFPALSKEAAELLVKRKIDGVGIDTASIDYGPSTDFIVHRVLNGANIYCLENVANLEKVPEKGATLIALPMKIKDGTGGPTRIIAVLP